MKKQYPYVLAVALVGVLVGSLFLTGMLPGNTSGTSAVPSADHSFTSGMPLDIKYASNDREKGFDALGANYLYVDENFIDDENHCEFCISVQYDPGPLGKAFYGFRDNSPVDLSDARTLTFLARGENGGETLKVYAIGKRGITSSEPEGTFKDIKFAFVKELTLDREWVEYEVNVTGFDMSKVSHPFAFEIMKGKGSERQTAYLDLILFDSKSSQYATYLN
ncbi:MAG TPA: hypothetical protein VJP79_06340 [Nitrososphaera sp.]|nr:hypothetical protein [Nitrososphaera sp.]